MKKNIIVIGMGELGSVFARGFLKLGYPVQGVTRDMDQSTVSQNTPDPEAVLVAVGETDLPATLAQLPNEWKDRLILIQNELLPKDWKQVDLEQPTVISVWFEKKQGMDSKQVISSPVYGPQSELVKSALATLSLDAHILVDEDALLFELVRKNLYILTTNISGLETGGDVKALAEKHADIMQKVVQDVLAIQDHLTQQKNDLSKLLPAMLQAFAGDPEHKCMGRSAPARLKRTLEIAQSANIEVTTLAMIGDKHLK